MSLLDLCGSWQSPPVVVLTGAYLVVLVDPADPFDAANGAPDQRTGGTPPLQRHGKYNFESFKLIL